MSEKTGKVNKLLITNGRLVTWGEPNEIIDDGAILLRDGRIAEDRKNEQPRSAEAELAAAEIDESVDPMVTVGPRDSGPAVVVTRETIDLWHNGDTAITMTASV